MASTELLIAQILFNSAVPLGSGIVLEIVLEEVNALIINAYAMQVFRALIVGLPYSDNLL